MKSQKLQKLIIHLFHRLLYLNNENSNVIPPIKDIKVPKNKIREIRSLMVDALYLVDHKIKLVGGSYVKVITVKMNKEEVLLEVEKKVGDKLDYYEIPYQ